MTLIIVVSSGISASAEEVGESRIYASKSSAVTLAENHIEDLIRLDNTCIWTDNTQITDIVNLYDSNNNVVSYLFELKILQSLSKAL